MATTSFHPFPRLPFELQRHICSFVLDPNPSIITLNRHDSERPIEARGTLVSMLNALAQIPQYCIHFPLAPIELDGDAQKFYIRPGVDIIFPEYDRGSWNGAVPMLQNPQNQITAIAFMNGIFSAYNTDISFDMASMPCDDDNLEFDPPEGWIHDNWWKLPYVRYQSVVERLMRGMKHLQTMHVLVVEGTYDWTSQYTVKHFNDSWTKVIADYHLIKDKRESLGGVWVPPELVIVEVQKDEEHYILGRNFFLG